MDIIKLAHLYDSNTICEKFNLKTFHCGTTDSATSGPPVLETKLCDNKPDCPDAQGQGFTQAGEGETQWFRI